MECTNAGNYVVLGWFIGMVGVVVGYILTKVRGGAHE